MSAQGKSGPKARAGAVADGEQVEIPVPLIARTAGTQEDRQTGERKNPAKAMSQEAEANPCFRYGEGRRGANISSEAAEATLSRKAAIAR